MSVSVDEKLFRFVWFPLQLVPSVRSTTVESNSGVHMSDAFEPSRTRSRFGALEEQEINYRFLCHCGGGDVKRETQETKIKVEKERRFHFKYSVLQLPFRSIAAL